MILYVLCFLLSGFAIAANTSKPVFKTAQDCANSTRCYCSEDGDYRNRKATDKPIYVANDPYGKYCYCTQWDLDHAPKATQKAIDDRKRQQSRPRGPKD
jgi:hypothetical protein